MNLFSKYSPLKEAPEKLLPDPPLAIATPHRPSRIQSALHNLAATLPYLSTALLSALITASLLTFPSPLPPPPSPSPSPSPPLIDTTCGHSLASALAANCTFDMMSSTWEAPPCHDAALLAETLAAGPWQWYRDAAHTTVVPRSEVARGQFPIEPLWPDHNYHRAHCMYMWKKQHRAFLAGGAVSEDLWLYNHTLHCAGLVVGGRWPVIGRTQAGFSVCRSPEVWERYEREAGNLRGQGGE